MSEAKKILDLVGGEENIVSVTHCMTRLRFVLKDRNKADVQALEELSIVKGTFVQSGQFQVIIGNDVAQIYKEMLKGSNVREVSKEEAKNDGKKNMNPLQKAATFLSEIFAPIIPAIIVGGLILGFRNVLEIPLGFLDGQAAIDINQFWSGLDTYLWLIGEAIFMYLPVHVTWSAYKKMGGTPVLGIVLGLTLVSPQLLSAYDVPTTPVNQIPYWDFGTIQIFGHTIVLHLKMIGYQAQVIPAMLVGIFGGKLETNLTKVVPSYVQMIVTPFVVLIVTSLLANIIIGPFGWWLGTLVASFVMWLFTTLGFIGGMIFGFIYAPLVITGLHHMTNAIDMQVIAQYGGTPLWPLIALSNIAQGSAVAAMIVLKKSAKVREITIPATISAYLGVTEPALFGVNLKYMYPFICGMIGSAIAGGVSVKMGVMANSIGVGGLPGILSIQAKFIPAFALSMCIAIVIPFVLTIIAHNSKIGQKYEPKTNN